MLVAEEALPCKHELVPIEDLRLQASGQVSATRPSSGRELAVILAPPGAQGRPVGGISRPNRLATLLACAGSIRKRSVIDGDILTLASVP